MYAILGITGKVGSAVADNLLKISLTVVAIVRDPAKADVWEKKGAVVAIADLKDCDALAAAFENVEGIFVMTPPLWDSNDPMGEHDQMLKALTLAIEKAQPKRIVYLSSVGGQLATGTGAIRKLYDLEQALSKLIYPVSVSGRLGLWKTLPEASLTRKILGCCRAFSSESAKLYL